MAANSANISIGIDDSNFLNSLNRDLNDFTRITRLMETAGQIEMKVNAASTQKVVSDFKATIDKINKLKGTISIADKGQSLMSYKLADIGKTDMSTIKNIIKTLEKNISQVNVKGGVNNDVKQTIELLQKAVDMAAMLRNEANKLSMIQANGKDSRLASLVKEYANIDKSITKLKANLKSVSADSSLPELQKHLSQLNKIANTQRSGDAALGKSVYAEETKAIEAEIAKIEQFIAAKKREKEVRKLDRQIGTQQRNYEKASRNNDLVSMRNAKSKQATLYETRYNNTGEYSARIKAEAARAEVAAIQAKIEARKRENKQLEQAIALEEKARRIEETIAGTGNQTIADLKRRVTLSNQLVETYKKLQSLTGMDYSQQIANAKRIADPVSVKYSRDTDRVNERIDAAKQKDDLNELKRAYEELARINERMAGYTGKGIFMDEAKDARNAASETQKLIQAKREEEKQNKRIESALKRLKGAEQDFRVAHTNNNAANTSQYNAEIMALKRMIAARRELLAAKGKSAEQIANDSNIRKSLEHLALLRQGKDALMAQNRAYTLQKSLLKQLHNLATRYFGLYAIINFAKKIAETTGYFQQQKVALEAITQDAQKASNIFRQLQDFSIKSPFEFKELVSFTKQLSAFQIPTDELFDTTKKLADISAGLGVDMQRIILAYGQVRSASVLRGQELRQFTEAGIPLVDELAKKFSVLEGRVVSTGEVFKRISERQVSFEMVKEILFSLTEEGGRFNNMQEKLADTTYGQIMNLKDAWNIALNDIGNSTSGIINSVLKLFRSLIDNWRATLGTVLGLISGTAIYVAYGKLISMGRKLAMSVETLKDKWLVLQKVVKRAGATMKAAMGGLVLGAAATVLGAVIGQIANAIHESKKLKKELAEIDSNASSKITSLTTNFRKLTMALQEAAEGSEEERVAYEKLLSTYSEYLPKQDLELENLRNLTDGYNNLTSAIIAKVRAQAKEEKTEAIMKSIGKDIERAARLGFVQSIGKKIDDEIRPVYEKELVDVLTNNISKSSAELEKLVYNLLEKYTPEWSVIDRRSAASLIVNTATKTRDKNLGEFIDNKEGDAYKAALDAGYSYNSEQFKKYVDTYSKVLDEREKTSEAVRDEVKTEGTTLQVGKTKTANKTVLRQLRDAELFAGAFKELGVIVNKDYNIDNLKGRIENGDYDRPNMIKTLDSYIDVEKAKQTDPAIISLLESISTNLQKSLTLYEQYENTVNGYLDNLVKGGDLNNGLSSLYSKFYMSPQTDLTEYVKNLQNEYNTHKQHFDQQLIKDPNRISDPTLAQAVREDISGMAYLKQIARYLNIDLDANNKGRGGGSGANDRAYNVFTSLFDFIKEGRKEMTELVGLKGFTAGFGDSINMLEDSNILKQFMQKGKNPFEQILKELTEDGAFGSEAEKKELLALKTRFEDIEGIQTPDFQAIWEDLEKIIANRLATLTKSNGDGKNNADIRRWSEYLTKFKKEGDIMFSRDKLDALISDAVNELKRIEQNTEGSSQKMDMFEQLSKVMRFDKAYEMVYGNKWNSEGSTFAQGTTKMYQAQLLNMLTAEGNGLGSELSSLIPILEGEKMNVSNLSLLMTMLEGLNYKKDNIPVDANDKEFTKIIDTVIKAIEKLINAIKSDEVSKIKTNIEELAQSIDNIDKWYEEWKKQNEDNSATNSNASNNDSDKRSLSEEAKQMQWAKKEDTFGITQDSNWTKEFFTDESSPNGISKKGNLLQTILGSLGGNGKGLESLIGDNILASNAGAAGGELAGMMSGVSSTLALVDAIIKAVYGAIKAITELGKSILSFNESINFATSYQKDEYGNAYTKTLFDANKMEISNMALDAVQTYNQHIMDGWEKAKSGDGLGSIVEVIESFIDLFKNINEISDKKIQQKIDELNEANNKLENKIEGLDFEKDFAAGSDKWAKDAEKLSTYYQQYINTQKILTQELHKKSADEDAIQEATENELEAYNKMLTLVREMREELIGTADDLADRLGSAMIEAFRNGENAARQWRNAVKEYMSEVLQDFIIQDWLAPQVQTIMNDWMGGSSEDIANRYAGDTNGYLQYMKTRLTDVDALKTANTQLDALGNTFEDFLNSEDDYIKDLLFYNSDTSSLSGGIESITEDTARRLEALSNSQLGEMVLIRTMLQDYILGSGTGGSSFADIQTSLAQMNSNVAMLVNLSQNIHNEITQMRYTTVQPLHVTMV